MVLKLLSIAWDDTLHRSHLWAVSGFGQQDNAINFFDIVCVVGCALRLWWVLRGGLLCLGEGHACFMGVGDRFLFASWS